jgi:predicted  nucleic acid-binding Zn-ribbon protein
MQIEVSNGELLDKLSILEIKFDRIKDPVKLAHVQHEFEIIRQSAAKLLQQIPGQYQKLRQVNEALWKIEDRIREIEAEQRFDQEFIETARMVYRYNDQRASIKKEINQLTGSELIEEKSYKGM